MTDVHTNPTQIYATDGPEPHTLQVLATVHDDPNDINNINFHVRVSWQTPQGKTVEMTCAGNGCGANVGPFDPEPTPGCNQVTVPFTVTATDVSGNIGTASGSFALWAC